MINQIIHISSEWNPQLFRELKSRLTVKSVTLTLLGSLSAQALLMNSFLIKLHSSPKTNIDLQSYTQIDKLGSVITDWFRWWGDILVSISWTPTIIMAVGGLYLLAGDLQKEEKRGTLNFIKLSPQKASEIFIGKILGVPILIHLALFLSLPLQLIAGAYSKFGLLNTLLWDGLWLVIIGIFYLVAILLILKVNIIPILLALLALLLHSLVSILMRFIMNAGINDSFLNSMKVDVTWFYLPMTDNISHLMIFTILSCSLLVCCAWSILCRHYPDSHATLISKKQSYEFNTWFQIWLLGIALPLSSHSDISTKGYLISIVSAQIVFALVLIKAIIPSKDTLQEWCCQADLRFSISGQRFWQQKWFNELFWEDRSPAVLTFGLNLVVAVVIWLPIGLIRLESLTMLPAACFIVLTMLNYGVLMQLTVSSKWRRYVNGFMIVLPTIVPIIIASMLTEAIIIELLITGVFLWLLWRQLQWFGQSST